MTGRRVAGADRIRVRHASSLLFDYHILPVPPIDIPRSTSHCVALAHCHLIAMLHDYLFTKFASVQGLQCGATRHRFSSLPCLPGFKSEDFDLFSMDEPTTLPAPASQTMGGEEPANAEDTLIARELVKIVRQHIERLRGEGKPIDTKVELLCGSAERHLEQDSNAPERLSRHHAFGLNRSQAYGNVSRRQTRIDCSSPQTCGNAPSCSSTTIGITERSSSERSDCKSPSSTS